MVRMGENISDKWCPFEYEYLPEFCYTCGIIGHEDEECCIRVQRGERQQYGRWMRAQIQRKVGQGERLSWEGNSNQRPQRGFSFGNRSGGSGSDGPTWRKDASSKGDNNGPADKTGEVTSPMKIQKELNPAGSQKKLTFEEGGIGISEQALKRGEDRNGIQQREEAHDRAMVNLHNRNVVINNTTQGQSLGSASSGVVEDNKVANNQMDGKRLEWLRWKLGLTNMVAKDSDGQSGGLVLFWRNYVNLKAGLKSRYHIDSEITEGDGFKWRFTGIYGESKAEKKEETWKLLRTIRHHYDIPWLCVGDFNEILFSWEKVGGAARPQSCMDNFKEALEVCELHDFGFVGDAFTWRNNSRDHKTYIKERLDRAVASEGWCHRFCDFRVINEEPRHSDHSPVVVEIDEDRREGCGGGGERPFRFEAAWMVEENCKVVIRNAWEREAIGRGGKVMNAIKGVAADLQDWKKSSLGDRMEELLSHVEPRVMEEMNSDLMKEFTEAEIMAALENSGDLKAPGPDGMPSFFYKKNWEVVGPHVVKEVLAVLNGAELPDSWNETWVTLIPKINSPEEMKHLRPISLCNVVFKLISKVLAARLKTILDEIISPNQSAFVPGRLITDNILLAYEATHYMKTKRTGVVGVAALKLDMGKAYDRVEWPFLEQMMLGFSNRWVALIMKCCTSVKYRFKLNGSLTEEVTLSRGIRQGDPISPYPFLICGEAFSCLLNAAEADGRLTGVRVADNAPSFNHLLFADDSLILLTVTEESASHLKNILELYECCSGQTAEPIVGMSYTWRSILKGNQLLKEGVIKRVGNGATINVWTDPWIPREASPYVISRRGNLIIDKASDLIDTINGGWDEELVKECMWPADVVHVLNIPLCLETNDCWAWRLDSKGQFSVQRGEQMWRRMVFGKVRDKLLSCTGHKELVHSILKLEQGDKIKSVALLWEWWKHRNKINAESIKLDIDAVVINAVRNALEYTQFCVVPSNKKPQLNQKWKPPDEGVIKVNTDGSFFAASNLGGWGYVIRDCNGAVLGVAADRIDNASDALHTEAIAVLKAIQAAADWGVSNIWVESDAQPTEGTRRRTSSTLPMSMEARRSSARSVRLRLLLYMKTGDKQARCPRRRMDETIHADSWNGGLAWHTTCSIRSNGGRHAHHTQGGGDAHDPDHPAYAAEKP
ncbi:hypothetical protein QYE76_068323 [Lolium multiflorum]|uniref:CCHC-type domain-containing protein n=1 Tax=Lolium multiflorum TaxID=4521 RepID=A0AAD8SG34_LOLMU|nr:hypothetical protein QYE76_068323 [Lolium multiflorum]